VIVVQFEYDAAMALARNEQVEPPVLVVVAPGRFAQTYSDEGGWSRIVERAPTVVMKQLDCLAIGTAEVTSGHQKIEAAIVVIIGPGHCTILSAGHTGRGGVVESAPSIVVVQFGHG